MPELPEAETICKDLEVQLAGCILDFVWCHKQSPVLSMVWGDAPFIPFSNRVITGVRRAGKHVLIVFEAWTHKRKNPDPGAQSSGLTYPDALVFGLGMTGQLFVAKEFQLPSRKEVNHCQLAAKVVLQDQLQGYLLFKDPRKFGKVFPTNIYTGAQGTAVYSAERLMRLGPDALAVTPGKMVALTGRMKRGVKQVLLDQHVIAGIGNIYASEILFAAGVDPRKPVNEISLGQWRRIVDAILSILTKAIKLRGSTISDYRDGHGQIGSYQNHHKVYNKAGKPCPQCGTAISRIDIDGRSTFYCPSCQQR